MLVPNDKEQVVIVDNVNDAEASKVQASLACYFNDYKFLKLRAINGLYVVAARADHISEKRANQMEYFSIGILHGMRE